MIMHTSLNEKNIKTIYCFLSEDSDGNEAITSVKTEDNEELPFLFTDEKLIPLIKSIIIESKPFDLDKKFKLYKFTQKEFIEEV